MDNNKKISPEMFEFVNINERLTDKKFDDKPIGFLKDAWLRFRKNKASVVAAIIILLICLFSIVAPLFTWHKANFMDPYYAKKSPRLVWLRDLGIADGGTNGDYSEIGLTKVQSLGVAAEDWEGKGGITIAEGMQSEYQPVIKINNTFTKTDANKNEKTYYNAKVDNYLNVGFLYLSIQQSELPKIQAFEQEHGIHILYPLIEDNEWNNGDAKDANNWYKMKKNAPVTVDEDTGRAKTLQYGDDLVLEGNYERDGEGNPVYWKYTGGGDHSTAQLKVRVLYYNWYRYQHNNKEVNYAFGTDSQGYDLMVRLAGGLRLSLLLAVSVSVINFIIGAAYGAIEGYYGGVVDLVMERVTDILGGIPFIIVATLFQIHLSARLGAIPCLIFAYILNGWIGIAYRVRTQFYRFKHQEFVLAARTLGAKDSRLIWKHVFPNSLGTIVTSAALIIPGVIFNESMLSYLGIVKLGSANMTSLGTLLADASAIWTNYPHLMILPALFISLLEISFNLFGNGLRDAFNPSLRNVED